MHALKPLCLAALFGAVLCDPLQVSSVFDGSRFNVSSQFGAATLSLTDVFDANSATSFRCSVPGHMYPTQGSISGSQSHEWDLPLASLMKPLQSKWSLTATTATFTFAAQTDQYDAETLSTAVSLAESLKISSNPEIDKSVSLLLQAMWKQDDPIPLTAFVATNVSVVPSYPFLFDFPPSLYMGSYATAATAVNFTGELTLSDPSNWYIALVKAKSIQVVTGTENDTYITITVLGSISLQFGHNGAEVFQVIATQPGTVAVDGNAAGSSFVATSFTTASCGVIGSAPAETTVAASDSASADSGSGAKLGMWFWVSVAVGAGVLTVAGLATCYHFYRKRELVARSGIAPASSVAPTIVTLSK
ncbi:hypothetical protein HDV03_001560 [Kappamyces sp. JEL0829]|nr:hypothetical protein HDV03_001560 [Kappamyces sp. JEL0829]